MKYLVVCDHEKFTVHATDVRDALQQCRCKKCKVMDLVKEQWVYKDVRVYREDGHIDAKRLPLKRTKDEPIEQIDWVGK